MIFDRYFEYSIKSETRTEQAGEQACRRPLPPQKVTLTVTQNKVQLIAFTCMHLTERCQLQPNHHRLVIIGKDHVPVELWMGILSSRQDLRTTHEEADVIMVQRMLMAAQDGAARINIVCEVIDVFVVSLPLF